MKAKGTLIPIGGNEDKGIETADHNKLDYIEDGILSRVVKESGGNDSSIVVIPTASSYPVEIGENYLKAFNKLDCSNVQVLDIRERSQSELSKNLGIIRNAKCVMFSGGNQSKITGKIAGTELHRLLLKKYRKEKFVIAGTSAGAMCMAEEMIAGGSSTEAFFKGTVLMSDGMGFVPNLIIDSHFIRRGRFGRLAEAVARYPKLIGVGLAEDTGLVIKECKTFEVIGSGMVIIFDPRKLKHNNEEILEEGTPMSLVNLKTHVLANGDRFNLKEKKVKVLPLEAQFV
ncbi:cyanophycinase [Aureitalea sp. L0-47]|uniref:cyanophycinase n=1 Tax=Aureitalea sp. L0-47 TaxID=2816962 RepID=UPI002237FE4C|nr:cyanophycinase [Aureitalea sp. L0-47]MCW5518919.1 cyanophycinase [Aureitalea sp. L0-47]